MKIKQNQLAIVSYNLIKTNIMSEDGFEIYTDSDLFLGDYSSYTTLYRELDGEYLYSNDGSVYVEPEPIPIEPIPIPEPYVPTEEELAEIERQNKIAEISNQIESLKFQISSTDYIIIKVSEWSFVNKECEEYDMVAIHTERQLIRDKINALEKELEVLYNERDII